MPTLIKTFSIRDLFVGAIMAVTALALVVASGIALVSQISTYKSELLQQTDVYAQMIGQNARKSLIANDKFAEEENLKVLGVAPSIENVHVYKLDANGNLGFFASYNNRGRASLPAMIHRVEELNRPQQNDGIFEIITPIKNNGQIVGYIYLRNSASALEELTFDSVVIAIVVLVIMLLMCFLLALSLQQSITKPIRGLANLLRGISTQRDYSRRAQKTNIQELDMLAASVNDMLDRTEDYMSGQVEAVKEHKRLRTSLEDKVNQRTLALKEANQELIETLEKLHEFQRQMVQNEKMASLGDMVAGVAHEVNTPIGLGVTASTMMLDRLAKVKDEFESKSLKASTLAKFIDEGDENLNIIYRNLNRAAELISSFKQVAVDQTSEDNRIFAFAQLMDEILLSMRPRLKKTPHKINVHCEPELVIESKAGPINQVMINLIMNSVIHGFEFMEQGQIDIYVNLVGGNKISIRYVDNGKGIPEPLRQRIFDPFVTTKRGQGGSGLGLHLVYNLVTQGLNGSIAVTSEEGHGVEFEITFPVKTPSQSTDVIDNADEC